MPRRVSASVSELVSDGASSSRTLPLSGEIDSSSPISFPAFCLSAVAVIPKLKSFSASKLSGARGSNDGARVRNGMECAHPRRISNLRILTFYESDSNK